MGENTLEPSKSKKKGQTKAKLNQSDNYHFEPSIFYMHNPNNFYPKRLFSNIAFVVVVAVVAGLAPCHATLPFA